MRYNDGFGNSCVFSVSQQILDDLVTRTRGSRNRGPADHRLPANRSRPTSNLAQTFEAGLVPSWLWRVRRRVGAGRFTFPHRPAADARGEPFPGELPDVSGRTFLISGAVRRRRGRSREIRRLLSLSS